ncbi:interferon-induced helicase C domain-containing protein 1 [Periophthalmus magnuspinnatus]|uniref:interferon-induced helicase C domain-containing protein 1 n=1 Tax=Periophthalmus magnuspinnatus TaxID=409849 RepID=UPI00145A774F|nr:interferon-induced helicase C domain-containing protein 1 [Periophthalmus magnuspinnatus]
MDTNTDEVRKRLIETFRPQLKNLIKTEQVVHRIHFLTEEQKEQILHQNGDLRAADRLITEVLKAQHEPGWFRVFVDALEQGGCERAAKYAEGQIPSAEQEADNDLYVELIRILFPSLLDKMDAADVCVHCYSSKLITDADKDIINAEAEPRNKASKLLGRIVKGPEGWFSTFLNILRQTEHNELYKLLSGQSVNEQHAEKDPSHRDEPTGNECPAPSPAKDVDSTRDSPEESTDLYKAENAELEDPTSSAEAPKEGVLHKAENAELEQPPKEDDECDSRAEAGESPKKQIVLRDYQMEVARPALEGKNIIVCLPTGSGKTRVAVYITKEHLDQRKKQGLPAKVIVLVNKVPLVEQLYSEEFLKFLKPTYKVERVSGNSELKISFPEIVKRYDVVVCTAQILENSLERAVSGEDEGVHLSDLSLIVIDECHHTQKGGVYNHIMMRFLTQKHKNKRLEKERKKTKPLPQILGLTASPGVGGATKMSKTEEHILRICANLDASTIMTANLGQYRKESEKKVESIEARKADPFGDVIKKIMNEIHEHAGLNPGHECGSQTYEQWVVQTERDAVKEGNENVRDCVDHLKQYNTGLQMSNTIRMCDAFSFLNSFYEDEKKKKTSPDGEAINTTDTERFLFTLFEGNKDKLMELAKNPEYENSSLSKLRTTILQEFTRRNNARGIIFTKTRRSAIALAQWVQDNPKFGDLIVNAAYLIGGGDQSDVKPMTSAEQKDVLKKFGNGEINLLIATTVAEEGLDIAACNFVIRYGLVTNEISMIQARGRGRAEDSTYTLVEIEGSNVAEKETVNEYRINMMNKAIAKIRGLNPNDYEKRILEFQIQAIMETRLRVKKSKQKGISNSSPSELKLICRKCNIAVCTGDDIEIIENMHRVNLSPQFSKLFMVKENNTLRERHLDYETNGSIACNECGNPWGSMMHYRGIDCPCLHVKNFAVTLNGKKISKCAKWSELPVKFRAFDYALYASQLASNSDEEDEEEEEEEIE